MSEPILMIRGVTKVYMRGEVPVNALNGVDLDIQKGEFVAIIGPSGSGKSTLLNMIGTLDRPTEGTIIIDGVDVTEAPERELPRIRREKIGFVFQQFNLLPTLTALANVDLAMRFSGVPKKDRRERAEQLLRDIGLGDRMLHMPTEMSGGEQQRVSIARALANNPAIILADEPTGEVDTKTRDRIIKILEDLNERGQTVIVVTHDPEIPKHVDRTLRMVDGRIAEDIRQETPE